MNIWVLEWLCDGDANCTLWNSRQDAQIQACSEIQDAIASDFDLDDPAVHAVAKLILDHMACGDYDKALKEWNEYQDDQHPSSYYFVSEKQVLSNPSIQNWILGPFGGDDADEDEKDLYEDEDDHPTLPPQSMQSSGATCRGPCKTYNEYAYADRLDGTYVCYQCKTFKSICSP